MKFLFLAGAAAAMLASAVAWADDPGAVTVSALRDPVDKSYRKMVDGMELFEKLHAMAPNAALRSQSPAFPAVSRTNRASVTAARAEYRSTNRPGTPENACPNRSARAAIA